MMKLTIDGQEHAFIPIQDFRAMHGLSQDFGLKHFELKDYTGLAAIDKAGAEMNDLRHGILASVPEKLTMPDLLNAVDMLQATFQAGLYGINDDVGLKVVEIEYAVAGFGDVLRNWAYALISARSQLEAPNFRQIYGAWFASSILVAQQRFAYAHEGQSWQIQVINHVYGRAGLRVDTGESIYYVQDGTYVCPAEGYMLALLTEIAALIQKRLER